MSIPVIGVLPLWDDELNSLWMLPGYMDGLNRAGALPVMLPLSSEDAIIERICQTVDGLLFTGGHDIFPGMYDEAVSAVCGSVCIERDNMEIKLFTKAVKDMNKPALGICRGIQLFNVALGGTLYQDLPSMNTGSSQFRGGATINHRQAPPDDVPSHAVTINRSSPLSKLIKTERIQVNSSHHQGIRELAPELAYMATAEDGLIEAVYMPGRSFVWAVQWHPELTSHDENSKLLFAAFIDACRRTEII